MITDKELQALKLQIQKHEESMKLSELIKMAETALKQHGDVPVSVLRAEGRTFIESPITGLVMIADNSGKAQNAIIDDGDLSSAIPKT